ncbi:MAG: hypothetical protein LBU22_09325 [Dysgonamonadaceae bacterium]|jgi:hypothetical protein|nr:hypothetical protein [Dysgonamonadaceae bacterium]
MQANIPQIRQYLSFLCLAVICYTSVHAQEAPAGNYLNQADDYAYIYNGRLEPVYSMVMYKELPYYRNADYTEASIVYRNNYYPNQKVRLDLFKEQLILLLPGKNYGIVLDDRKVNKVSMYNKTFVWLSPPKESKLKNGYYMQLHAGKNIQLFCKETYSLEKKMSQERVTFYFDRAKRYYLLHNNRYRTVKNKTAFSKSFPQYKKQINQFVKEHKLDFKQNPDESLTTLAAYCEELTNSTNKP